MFEVYVRSTRKQTKTKFNVTALKGSSPEAYSIIILRNFSKNIEKVHFSTKFFKKCREQFLNAHYSQTFEELLKPS